MDKNAIGLDACLPAGVWIEITLTTPNICHHIKLCTHLPAFGNERVNCVWQWNQQTASSGLVSAWPCIQIPIYFENIEGELCMLLHGEGKKGRIFTISPSFYPIWSAGTSGVKASPSQVEKICICIDAGAKLPRPPRATFVIGDVFYVLPPSVNTSHCKLPDLPPFASVLECWCDCHCSDLGPYCFTFAVKFHFQVDLGVFLTCLVEILSNIDFLCLGIKTSAPLTVHISFFSIFTFYKFIQTSRVTFASELYIRGLFTTIIINDTHFSPNIDNNWPVFLPWEIASNIWGVFLIWKAKITS